MRVDRNDVIRILRDQPEHLFAPAECLARGFHFGDIPANKLVFRKDIAFGIYCPDGPLHHGRAGARFFEMVVEVNHGT